MPTPAKCARCGQRPPDHRGVCAPCLHRLWREAEKELAAARAGLAAAARTLRILGVKE